MDINDLTGLVIGCSIEVHRFLGPGKLESSYETCLEYELKINNLLVGRQVAVPIIYKGIKLDCGYRIDLLVENRLVIELKSIECFAPVHEFQILSYMKFANVHKGLLINFNVPLLKEGIRRFTL